MHSWSGAIFGKMMLVKSQWGAQVLLPLCSPAWLLQGLKVSFCPVSRGEGFDSLSPLTASDSFGCSDKGFSLTGRQLESPQSSSAFFEVPSASAKSSDTFCFFSCDLKTEAAA